MHGLLGPSILTEVTILVITDKQSTYNNPGCLAFPSQPDRKVHTHSSDNAWQNRLVPGESVITNSLGLGVNPAILMNRHSTDIMTTATVYTR